jgi:hypothetical protein
MTRDLPIVVNELLRYRLASQKATEALKTQKHNVDLCPRVRSQLEVLLQSYVKYDAVAYDVQGIHDQGTDVVLKFYPQGDGADGPWEVIAFQVKSYDDLKKKDYLKDLRSQRLQADDEYGDRLTQYVILLCTDEIEHQNKIREISKAFSKIDKTLVVLPGYAFNFLRLRQTHVNLVVDTFEKSDDIVLERAQNYVGGMPPTRAGLLLYLVYHALHDGGPVEPQALIGDVFLKEVYGSVPAGDLVEMFQEEDDADHPIDLSPPGGQWRSTSLGERLAQDLDALVGNVVVSDLGDALLRVDVTMGRPLQALLLDLEVRYEVSGHNLLEHVFGLLGVLRRYGLEYGDSLWEDA